jgi:hypothetical protein
MKQAGEMWFSTSLVHVFHCRIMSPACQSEKKSEENLLMAPDGENT